MPTPQLVSAQRDFSGGEGDPEVKRRDDLPLHRASGRQMSDWRIRNTGILEQRPGRRALYLQTGRIDQVSVSPGLIFDLCFGGDGSFVIRDQGGTIQAGSNPAPAAYPWRLATVDQIVWGRAKVDVSRTDVIVTFPGMRPVVASYNAGWTLSAFAFAIDGTGAALAPFYRVAAPGSTMQPSATGAAGAAITAHWSAAVLNNSHVGALFRFAGRRVRIDVVTGPQDANITVIDALLRTQQLTVARPDGAVGGTGVEGFSFGQVVRGSTSESEGEVVGINLGANQLTVQLTNFATGFLVSAAGPPEIKELLVGPNGKSKVTAVVDVAPLPAVSWDEQLMSDARGWPQSCSTDAGRLIFCDFPATPDAIAWSVTGQPYNFTVGANATDAIVEVIAGKPRIYHVAAWTDEIVFTDQGVFYIPINQTNPLAPGSVKFQPVSPDAASSAKPAFASDGYLYINAGRNRIMAVIGSGASLSTRPYVTRDVSMFHTHLFTSGPKAIAISTGDDQFPEAHAYVTNADGSIAVGKFDPAQQWIGWLPWRGAAAVTWVSALRSAVRFVSVYPVLGIAAGISVGEALDENEYVDAAILINAPPATMPPPAGKGPFYWLRLGTVELMDGLRPMGAHAIDANGFVTPAYQGEDLSIATITAGLGFTPIFEPFIPDAQPGQDVKQRMIRRSVSRAAVSVKNSSGFKFCTLHSGKTGPNRPALGAIVKERRVPPWNQGDNQALAPPLREDTYTFRPSGRSYDPRVAVIKDVPGPLQLIEVGIEASV